MTTFKDLALNSKILDALTSKGYVTPTPIQEKSIPHILNKEDLLGIAQTGTGKTASFCLPIIHNLYEDRVKTLANKARVLILTPTRELAAQISDNIKLYSKGLGLSHNVIFGGTNIENQVRKMKKGSDIIVATPGRLLDLMKRGCVNFSELEVLVLDEADRMLDMGFIHDVKRIIKQVPFERQTLFFSATMPESISKLANSILRDPKKVQITPESTTVEKIEQKVVILDRSYKMPLLQSIIEQDDAKAVLIFSKTKHGANRIATKLEAQSIKVAAIHGNKAQSARERALDRFRKGKMQALVATDIAARGIDVPSITHVVNYDIPNDPQNYVHRIGRTARAGRKGVAISLCDPSEIKLLKAVEKAIRMEIPVDESNEFHGLRSSSSPKAFAAQEREMKKSSVKAKGRDSRKKGFDDGGKKKVSEKEFDDSGKKKPSKKGSKLREGNFEVEAKKKSFNGKKSRLGGVKFNSKDSRAPLDAYSRPTRQKSRAANEDFGERDDFEKGSGFRKKREGLSAKPRGKSGSSSGYKGKKRTGAAGYQESKPKKSGERGLGKGKASKGNKGSSDSRFKGGKGSDDSGFKGSKNSRFGAKKKSLKKSFSKKARRPFANKR